MNITVDKITKLKPCKDRFDNFTKHYPDFSGDLKSFIELENITYSDKVWVVTRLFTKEQNVAWSILCAESVLPLFEEKYPDDKRPRLAIEAAKAYQKDPSVEAKRAAWAAAEAAAAAAAWAAAAAARAARAAAAAAEAAAAWAAWAAAAWAAWAAWAAEKEQETKNLSFMLMCEEL